MDILQDIFDFTMRNEGKTATIRGSGNSFKCFFRRNSDGTNMRDTMVVYYPVSAPVVPGLLLIVGGKSFLTLNKETTENEVYYKSAVERCNGTLTTNDFAVNDLPIFGDTVNNSTSTESTYFNLIDGNVELLTEDCELSRALSIDQTFNEWGRTWKITNLFYIDGICHIVAEVAADQSVNHDYSLTLSGFDTLSFVPGEVYAIYATAYIDGKQDDTATIKYTSSDDEVATIDDEGTITFLSPGDVMFYAYWEEQGFAENTAIITCASPSAGYELYVQSCSFVYYGFEETLQYYVAFNGVKVDNIPITFTIENVEVAAHANKITVTDNGDTITVLANSLYHEGHTFDLVGRNEEYGLENRQTIMVKSLF